MCKEIVSDDVSGRFYILFAKYFINFTRLTDMYHGFNIMTSKSSICSKSFGQPLLFGCMFFITSIFLVYNYCLNQVMLL